MHVCEKKKIANGDITKQVTVFKYIFEELNK